MSQNLIAQIAKTIAEVKGCKFTSLTYLSKSANELARYTVNIGHISYIDLLNRSITELTLLMEENKEKWNVDEKLAASEMLESFNKSVTAHMAGEQNEDYTKKGQYIAIGNGVNLNTNDNTIQLFGLVQSKVVLVEGQRKKVNSSAKTIAKKKLKKLLPIGKFREFALDLSQVAQVKVNGEVLEIGPE